MLISKRTLYKLNLNSDDYLKNCALGTMFFVNVYLLYRIIHINWWTNIYLYRHDVDKDFIE